MSCDVLVIGLPPAANCAPQKTWRAAAGFLERRLAERCGPAVRFEYAELFTPDMASHPEIEALVADGALPPIVLIDGACRFAGGKLHVSAIERAVVATLEARLPVRSPTEEAVS